MKVKSCLLSVIIFGMTCGTVVAAEVNVYSYRQPFLIKPIFDVFTRETGIAVNVVFAKSGLVERLKSEGANSPADLIITSDISRLSEAVEAELTQPVNSDVLQSNLPEEYRDPDNHWFGLTTRARIIVQSKDRMQLGDINSYADLANPKLNGKICTRSGKHPYMLGLIGQQIVHTGVENTEAWLRGVRDNLARKPQGNDRAQVKAISQGECDVAIINSYYMGAMQTNEEQSAWAASVDIVFPDQEGGGTHMNLSGVALTKSSPNTDSAIKLMEFLSQELAQSMYAEQNHEYPANIRVSPSGLVRSWGEFKKDSLPLKQVSDARIEASKLVDIVNYDN